MPGVAGSSPASSTIFSMGEGAGGFFDPPAYFAHFFGRRSFAEVSRHVQEFGAVKNVIAVGHRAGLMAGDRTAGSAVRSRLGPPRSLSFSRFLISRMGLPST